MLTYPSINPIALQLGPLAIRWYSLAYVGGILLGWWVVASEHARRPIAGLTKKLLDDMISWAVIGIILGGRLGHVLFYSPAYYAQHPLDIFKVWEGGMSFHGGLIGVIAIFFWFCRKHQIRFLELMDVFAAAAPIGLCLGRLANFINGELYGRPSDVPWAMVFPQGGELPRHPSQLYEAGLEGVLLFAIIFSIMKLTRARERTGLLSGLFLIGYALCRMTSEFFREPEGMVGPLTYGQFLCLPMLAIGLFFALKSPPPLRGRSGGGPA